ncbi:FAD-dependent monooxygenase [Saccharopolyspora erythraea]|uniref:NAD(P)/FAD-dependent oxidoreductase n=1 Tax=Saccharopolyspora erythraea TaxID=1836 RepID=UPI001BA592E0|nr:NAD(P)/FAD-dependent oxidoreductase [Saccharopolyspora erythraea]QUH03183.1 FAD-dependent monooxygenase [Saccharopolyspora erythraea]
MGELDADGDSSPASKHYDVIVVGARCAGAPLAMLLARAGHSVLLLDRAHFPSDTMSTHWILRPGVELLSKWGLLPDLMATGCPPIRRISLCFGSTTLSGEPTTPRGTATTFAPRRTVLDALLTRAARAAGAELREGFAVRDVLREDGRVRGVVGQSGDGRAVVVRSRLVIGADGRSSTVARAVRAPFVEDRGALAAISYDYWSDVPVEGVHAHFRNRAAVSLWPTHDTRTVVSLSFPRTEFAAHRGEAERYYLRALRGVPEVAERIRAGHREGRFHTAASLRNFTRRSHGPGWALAGDAAHHKDPITAWGISEAFTDAQALAAAVHAGLTGLTPMERALARYEERRNAARAALLDFTCEQACPASFGGAVARLVPAIGSTQDVADELAGVIAGSTHVEDFMHPANIVRIMDRGTVVRR